jgi:hypothetical protein
MPNVIKLNVIMSLVSLQCNRAQCHYIQCHGTPGVMAHSVSSHSSAITLKCHHTQCHHTQCHCTQSRHTSSFKITKLSLIMLCVITLSVLGPFHWALLWITSLKKLQSTGSTFCLLIFRLFIWIRLHTHPRLSGGKKPGQVAILQKLIFLVTERETFPAYNSSKYGRSVDMVRI